MTADSNPGPTRRGFLAGGALLGVAGATFGARQLAGAAPLHSEESHSHGVMSGATFRGSGVVDPAINGFDPTKILRDFDYGKVSTLPNGRTLREWTVTASDKDIEIAPGVKFPSWLFNGRTPGPTLRATEGDRLRIRFINNSKHPHTMHFHSIHPSEMDGVPGQGAGLVAPGSETTYEIDAEPFGFHLYHCHANPLAEHIARGMYAGLIIDPDGGRPDADEMVMIQNGWNTTFDGEGNQMYAVNAIPFHYMYAPIQVKKNKLVRIYLGNMLEYDPINSFHLHANFFKYYPTGTSLVHSEFTDTIIQGQGQRGILEVTFPFAGKFMFHAHKSEFADLGWMGFFEVTE
ncbi:multicopper oxidase domain-containing protein [Smaragdicoccus niigatensis]|uniref:multicopper oxidase domain-containing protein n=1 Tax=Smaragdicoccus niigatensis TaxID=359359 RepID=UPI00036B69A0|nr:multicopper oxidase domain-containing protein [Smaragdicoccus niigatensis]